MLYVVCLSGNSIYETMLWIDNGWLLFNLGKFWCGAAIIFRLGAVDCLNTALTVTTAHSLNAEIVQHPTKSIRWFSRELNISNRSLRWMRKELGFHSYKTQLLHVLCDNDFVLRADYWARMLAMHFMDSDSVTNVMFT